MNEVTIMRGKDAFQRSLCGIGKDEVLSAGLTASSAAALIDLRCLEPPSPSSPLLDAHPTARHL